ncbi:hypothetical protein BDD12DRAFT_784945 [Trichophaea hybrida]|nr:hypothetical protein BDD12DRAFT_784945 [Trichophaea hybrida]
MLLVYDQCLFPFINDTQSLGLDTHYAIFPLISMEVSTIDVVSYLLAMADVPEPGQPFLAEVKAAAESFLRDEPHATYATPLFKHDEKSLLSLMLKRGFHETTRHLLKHKGLNPLITTVIFRSGCLHIILSTTGGPTCSSFCCKMDYIPIRLFEGTCYCSLQLPLVTLR